MLRTVGGVAIVVVLTALGPAAQRATPIPPQDLAAIWDAERVSPPVPPLIDHADVERRLTALAQADPRFILERVGSSVEGRSINLVTIGMLLNISQQSSAAMPKTASPAHE